MDFSTAFYEDSYAILQSKLKMCRLYYIIARSIPSSITTSKEYYMYINVRLAGGFNGVLHRCVLNPMLFIMFINDPDIKIKSFPMKIEDNMKIFWSIEDFKSILGD